MIGARLGSWVIDRELGRGGMGQVYLAHEEPGGRLGAVKVLAPELAKDSGFLHRFQREIDALSQLDHPHIVHFFEAGQQDGHYYYVMEYVDGRSFEELLHERYRLPWSEVLDAALQICPALKHAHDRGIIHRDLKPPNLLRTADGVVKLTDFGIAKVFASTQLTATGGIVGTAEYLSPEQAAGKPVTKRSDLYSFGVVLYTLVTGRTPFEGTSMVDLLHKHRFAQFDRPQKLVPELPYEFDQVICHLLEKDPARRPGDGMVLQRMLESIRRKQERKVQATMAGTPGEATRADTREEDERKEGPGTLMSRLMRQELDRQNRGGTISQIFNSPWVLVPLFLVCVGLLVWTFWFRDVSDDDEGGPPPDQSPSAQAVGEAERIYREGLEHQKGGNLGAAQRAYRQVIDLFGTVDVEREWVKKAREGLDDIHRQDGDKRWASVRFALKNARRLRDKAKDPKLDAAERRDHRTEAERIWKAIEERYGNDPSARAVLKEMRDDRGQ
jgi:serine/threonine-protein kinase